MSSVAFLYGLGEGPLQSRRFSRHLTARGYTLTDTVSQADILIAHSGGCLIVPPIHRASLIMLIDYTDWPGRSLFHSHWQRQLYGLRTYKLRWISMTFANIVSMFRVLHTVKLARAWPGRGKTITQSKSTTLVFVRNQYDDFCDPSALLANQPDNCFISIEGGHDDCWLNPDRYISLLAQY